LLLVARKKENYLKRPCFPLHEISVMIALYCRLKEDRMESQKLPGDKQMIHLQAIAKVQQQQIKNSKAPNGQRSGDGEFSHSGSI
jgi:hypothetical protein